MEQQKIDFNELEKHVDEFSAEAREFIRKQPLTAVIGALLIGFLLAWMLSPSSSRRQG